MTNLANLTKPGLVDLLNKLVNALDELDNDDFFGTEGWRYFLNMEDEGL